MTSQSPCLTPLVLRALFRGSPYTRFPKMYPWGPVYPIPIGENESPGQSLPAYIDRNFSWVNPVVFYKPDRFIHHVHRVVSGNFHGFSNLFIAHFVEDS